jgi:hypothetical protein
MRPAADPVSNGSVAVEYHVEAVEFFGELRELTDLAAESVDA